VSKFLHYSACPKCQDRGRDSRGDNLGNYADGSQHCWACNYHNFPKHYVKPTIPDENKTSAVLPSDWSREVPAIAWQWLLQYGLSYSYWKDKVGWGEKDSRLVFPVGAGPEFSIGRYIERPDLAVASTVDHVHRKPRKWFVWGESHKAPHIFGDYGKAKQVVLVEDLISAHKVGAITCCIPLFGTEAFNSLIPVLRHIGLPVVLWLDKDQEGTLQKKCNRLAALTGLSVSYRVTTLDPKILSSVKIGEVLNDSST